MTRNETLEGPKNPGCAAQAALPGSEGPLGNTTDFATPYTPEQQAEDDAHARSEMFVLKCYRVRAHGRSELNRVKSKHRVGWCGQRMGFNVRGVALYRRPDRATGRLGNLCVCGQSLVCAVCSPRVAMRRANEVREAAEKWLMSGGALAHITLTAPHKKGSPLADEVEWWANAWRSAYGEGKTATTLRAQRAGYVNGFEATWSDLNGWHVHRHLLFFHRHGLDVEAHRRRWLSQLGERWSPAAEQRAFSCEPVVLGTLAMYCSKIGAEIAMGSTKEANTPLSMLAAAAETGAPCPQWLEAVATVAKRKISVLRWSRGLKSVFGLDEETEAEAEEKDVDAAKEEVTPSDELLGALSPWQWRAIWSRKLEHELLREIQAGAEAVELWLQVNDLGRLWMDAEHYEEFLSSAEENTEPAALTVPPSVPVQTTLNGIKG